MRERERQCPIIRSGTYKHTVIVNHSPFSISTRSSLSLPLSHSLGLDPPTFCLFGRFASLSRSLSLLEALVCLFQHFSASFRYVRCLTSEQSSTKQPLKHSILYWARRKLA